MISEVESTKVLGLSLPNNLQYFSAPGATAPICAVITNNEMKKPRHFCQNTALQT